jgi:hypothetical protein
LREEQIPVERGTLRGLRHRKPGRVGRAAEAPDAVESATRQSVRKGAVSMLVAATMLLVFNSGGLRTWARGLPGNAATDMLVEGTDRWHVMMQRAGMTKAITAVQDAVAAFRDQGWPGTGILSHRPDPPHRGEMDEVSVSSQQGAPKDPVRPAGPHL